MRWLARFTYLIGYILLSSCTTISMTNTVTVDDRVYTSQSLGGGKPTTPAPVEVKRSGVVCKDVSVMELKGYTLPPTPDIMQIDADDYIGQMTLLLDHIDQLRKDLRTHVKDYGCK